MSNISFANELIFKKNEIFNIQIKNQKFKLNISYNEKIIFFKIEEENNSFPKKEFSLYQSLNELIGIDKYFRQFDNLDEVFDTFKFLISNKNLTITHSENLMKIIIKYLNKEIFINILYKEKDVKSEINSLITYSASLNKKIIELENIIKDNKIEFENKLKNIKENLKNQILNNKKEFEKKIEELTIIVNNLKNEKKKDFFKNSCIVNSDENDLIFSWFNKVPKDYKLLLDSRIDDDSIATFMKKCENFTPIIIFIKTSEDIRFGGFCSINWPKSGWKRDEKSFIFSLSRKEIYKVNDPEYAIGNTSSIICFGCDKGGSWDLLLYDNYLKKGGETWKHIYPIPENKQLNNGNNKFKVSNVEVYQLIF